MYRLRLNSCWHQALSPMQYYMELFERGSAFIDCGEASLNQLCLALGARRAAEALAKLRFVWISHIHADHHLGLIQYGPLWLVQRPTLKSNP